MNSKLIIPIHDAQSILTSEFEHLSELDLNLTSTAENSFSLQLDMGGLELNAANDEIHVSVEGRTTGNLESLQSFIVTYLTNRVPELERLDLKWKGFESGTDVPANFRAMTVIRRQVLNAGTVRVTVQGERLETFAEGGLHISLLIPDNPDLPVVWPRKTASGKIQFPEEGNRLHRRVYTIRAVRLELGEMDVDLVRHPGGVAADWAETARVGQSIGVMGPVGGQPPLGEWLLIGGDETALPAIARLLESCSPEVKGSAFISLRDPSYKQELKGPKGINVTWISSDEGALCAAMKSVMPPSNQSFSIWFAAEQAEAVQLREYFKKDLGLATDQYRCSSYWVRGRERL